MNNIIIVKAKSSHVFILTSALVAYFLAQLSVIFDGEYLSIIISSLAYIIALIIGSISVYTSGKIFGIRNLLKEVLLGFLLVNIILLIVIGMMAIPVWQVDHGFIQYSSEFLFLWPITHYFLAFFLLIISAFFARVTR